MTISIEVFGDDEWAARAAALVSDVLPAEGSVVLTGGTSAEQVYPELARIAREWRGLEILFSDERCVPPDHPDSNFAMAKRLLLDHVDAGAVHRMRGEDDPEAAAAAYGEDIAPLVERGLDLVLLGMGADAHVGANFPGAPSLSAPGNCAVVARPDGLTGLTLTPRAITSGKKVLLLVTGEGKAATVERVLYGDEPVESCPARMLADHPDATFLLDESAAGRIGDRPS